MPEIHASTPIHTQGSGIIFSQLEMYKSTDTLKKSFKKEKKYIYIRMQYKNLLRRLGTTVMAKVYDTRTPVWNWSVISATDTLLAFGIIFSYTEQTAETVSCLKQ